jgi:Tol biopolymer transport system component
VISPTKLSIVVLAVCASWASATQAQTSGRIQRVSVDSSGVEVSGSSGQPSVSPDGRFIAFVSEAPDLVPGDTNQDADVFVHDRRTGVVQRVSLAWNGMEARDDSDCPSISADGRYVAFRSLAWNLYPGGANLGRPRWDVYVRDRQLGTTTRISVSTTGGDPSSDSGCPSISGDGRRVAFASHADNLVDADGNQVTDVFLHDRTTSQTVRLGEAAGGGDPDGVSGAAVISTDGRFVAFESRATNLLPSGPPFPPQPQLFGYPLIYVHDLETGATTLASRASTHPLEAPDGGAGGPAISGDGRFVAFRSGASNLVTPVPMGNDHFYVHDRVAGETTLVSPRDPQVTECGRDGDAFPCLDSRRTDSQAAISGDGRFVAFVTDSLRLLPANQYHGPQTYLFDRIGGRLRRLSVEGSGMMSEGCSAEPALSGDGKLAVYRSSSARLVPGDTNQLPDVFAQEWTCNDAGVCRLLAACPSQPAASCASATSSRLRLRKQPPGGMGEDDLFWRWAAPGSGEVFPTPLGGSYQLCLYAKQERVVSLDVAAADAPWCSGGLRPCWRALGKGYKLVDPRGGITSLLLTSSSSSRRIVLRGEGSLLDAPYLPLDGSQGLTVQLHEVASGQCWESEFPAESIERNTAGVVEPGKRRSGRLWAELP